MNDMALWALMFWTAGIFFFGIHAGENLVVVRDRRRKIIRAEGPDSTWLLMGTVAIIVTIALAIVAINPPEKMKAIADQIHSATVNSEE